MNRLGLVVAAQFGLFYAYDLWEAVSPFVALPAFYDAYGYGSENVPWWLLWIGVLIPPVVYAVAFSIGIRHNLVGKLLIFLVGLAVVAALSIGVVALEDVLRSRLMLGSN